MRYFGKSKDNLFPFFSLEKVTLYTEEVCLAAVVPTLTILEGSMTMPSFFHDVLQFLTKVSFQKTSIVPPGLGCKLLQIETLVNFRHVLPR